MEQTQLATVQNQSGFLAPVVSVENALLAYQAKKQLIDGIMHEGVDFGVIPGTKKPCLLKAGAEKATSFFGLYPIFEDAEVIEDWTGQDHGGEPFFYYRRTCNLHRNNQIIASVDGSCNSWELKYRYRWLDESKVPSHIDKSKLKTQGGKISEFAFAVEKSETTGKYGKPAEYWQRFRDAIENGTAIKIQRKTSKGQSDAWEIDGTLYCLPNENPADVANTVLKMADKRALVAATLIATGMSEYFTQDIDDYITPGDYIDGEYSPEGNSNSQKSPSQAPNPKPMTPAEIAQARKNLYKGESVEILFTMTDSKGKLYCEMPNKTLAAIASEIENSIKKNGLTEERKEELSAKRSIALEICRLGEF